MMFRVTVFTNKKLFNFWLEQYDLLKLISNLNKTEEFKVGETSFIPSEITNFSARKYYLSKVSEADE